MSICLRRNRFKSPSFTFHLQTLVLNLQRMNHTLVREKSGLLHRETVSEPMRETRLVDMSNWKKLDSRCLGIHGGMISKSSWLVVCTLQGKGYKAYLVGGCVRDLLLNKTPKDFDVITNAKLNEVKKSFPYNHTIIVGRLFPICIVNVKGCPIEVSSFETVAKHAKGKKTIAYAQMPSDCEEADFIRWNNCLTRDFTINSLFFDPIQKKIYDYANGMNDIKLCQVRTVVPAKLSFEEDCARILRGLRIAARLGLSIHKETAIAIQELHSSIMGLSSSRLMMELNFMLSYGAAESSLCLLRKFGILEFMLPFHAAYLAQQDLDKIPRNSVMLLKLFSSVDEVLSCDRPSNCSLWVGLLAFHMTLVSNPQSVSVILAFASVLYHGNWGEAVKFVRENAQGPICFLPELSEVCADKSDKELAEDVTKLAVLVKHSLDALTNTQLLLQAMDRYPVPAFSAPIFIPKKSCVGLFDVLREVMEPSNKKRKTFEIDYSELRKGYLHEVRFVIGKVIIDTMNCMIIPKQHCEVVEQQFKLAKEVHDRTLSCLEQKENTKKEKPCLAESHLKEQLKEDVKEESTIRKGEVVQDVKKRKLQAKKEKLCLPESHLKEPLKEDVKGESNIRKGEVVKDVKKRKLQAKKEKPCLPEYHLKALPKEDVKEESNIRKGEVVKDVKKRKLQVKKKKPCLPESHLKEQLKEDVKEESNIRKGEVVKNVKKLKLQECNLEEKDRKKCSMHCADEILEKVKRDMLKEDKKQWKVQEYNLEKQLEVVTGSKKEYVNEDKIDSRLLLLNERKNATVEEHKLSVIKDNKKCRIPLSAMFR